VFGIGVVLFATPLRLIWADPARPWYVPFLLWGLVNLLVYWVARVSRGHET
jgi:hypothetical protein